MKVNQLKSGVILSYLTQGIHILSGLIYTPVMLRLLGQSEYGLYQLVSSVVSYLSLLSMGFGTSYIRFYSRYKAQKDKNKIAELNGMFFVIFIVISLICLLCGGVMVINADIIFGSGLTPSELFKARILMAMLIFNMSISFLDSVFKSTITAQEKFFFQKIVEFLKALFNPFITLPLLLFGFGSIGMVAVTTILTIAVFFMDMHYSLNKLKVKFSFKKFNFGLLKEMWIFTFFIFINMVIDQINWSIDKFLLGRMMGTVSVAVYGVAGNLNSMYQSFSLSISNVFVPRVNRIIAEKNDDKILTQLFTKVGRIQFLILGLIISGFIVFGGDFIAFWAGESYDEAYIIAILLMLPVTIPLIQNLGIEIQRAKNMHKARSLVYFFIALSNIFISIPCIKIWGASGAAIGTAISLIIGNGIFMNIYYHKKIGLDIIYFWKEILKLFPALIVTLLFGIILKVIVPFNNLIFFTIGIVLYSTVYFLFMWKFGMNESEKQMISGMIKKVGSKLWRRK